MLCALSRLGMVRDGPCYHHMWMDWIWGSTAEGCMCVFIIMVGLSIQGQPARGQNSWVRLCGCFKSCDLLGETRRSYD